MIWLTVLIFSILGYCCFTLFKKVKQHRLRCENIRTSLNLPIKQANADYTAWFAAGLAVGECLWQVYTIDPNVIKAVDFSSKQDLNSVLEVSDYLLLNKFEKDQLAFAGFKNRLIGYIGEQNVTELLESQGKDVILASTSNQAIWDLQIDGELVNVKTVLDVANIKNTALAHPNVSYWVPEDRYVDTGVANIQPFEGLNHEDTTEQFDSTIEQINGNAALESYGMHFPLAAGIFAWRERQRLLEAGGDENAVNKNMLIDFSSKTVSSLAMAKVGGAVGLGLGSLLFMPVIGGIVGAGIGAFIGTKLGAFFGKKIKELELNIQNSKLEVMLDQFGCQYLPYIEKLKYHAKVPLIKKQRAMQEIETQFAQRPSSNKIKNYFFPDLNWIFYKEIKKIGQKSIDESTSQYANIEHTFMQIEAQKDSKAMAILVLNNIHLRDLLHIDLLQIKKIYDQKRIVYSERHKLYPDKFPLSQDIINHRKLY